MVRNLKIAGVMTLVVALAATAALAGGAKPAFTGLGAPFMVPSGMTADGSKIVGTGYFGAPAFYWTAAEGVVEIGGGCGAGTASISGDGSTIVNCMIDDSGSAVAARWLGDTSWQSLGSVAGAVPCDISLSSSWGIDYSGRTAVGLVWLAQQCRAHAGSWDLVVGGPATDLGSLVERNASRANAISGDGHVIAGWQDGDTGSRQGARWIDGIEEYVLTPAGENVGEVATVNFDGSVMAGSNIPYGTNNAWVWTAQKGFTVITSTGPPAMWTIVAAAASDDGSSVGGIARDQMGNAKGWIWFAKGGKFVWMSDYIAKNRLAPGWKIAIVGAISADGSVLAGMGLNPSGQVEGWTIRNFK